jgi:soluble cytochrome b562
MKNILFVASALALALALGCKPAGEKPVSQSSENTAQQLEKAQIATKDAAQQIKDYTFGQKTEFVVAMQAQLTDLNRGMDELSEKIGKSSEAVQAEAKPKLAVLREKATQLSKQLDEASNATLSTWGVIKGDTEKAYAVLKNGLAQSRQAVSDKIAP